MRNNKKTLPEVPALHLFYLVLFLFLDISNVQYGALLHFCYLSFYFIHHVAFYFNISIIVQLLVHFKLKQIFVVLIDIIIYYINIDYMLRLYCLIKYTGLAY